MSRHPRVEELPDSDQDSDPPEMDPSDFLPSPPISRTSQQAPSISNPSILSPSQIPFRQQQIRTEPQTAAQAAASKTWQSLYPIYFDANRTRAQGRRVRKNLAVENPLATEIADACSSLGFKSKLEVLAAHPKDWANVGRVRIPLKDGEFGTGGREKVKNKHHLYILVSEYLKSHTTTEQTPLRLPVIPGEKAEVKPPPAVPRGWKVNKILPLHSPAVKGHWVTDNPLKEAMAQLGDMPGASGGGSRPDSAQGSGAEEGAGGKKKKKNKKG